jgi:hypothetical protein
LARTPCGSSIARRKRSGTSVPASPKPAVKSISMPFIVRKAGGASPKLMRDGRDTVSA